ncbi:hypothetical protein MTR_2g438620 [Medicago truncatula]|uniref:Uncharacterized protein n=1 Tax=Medicago truncatula TaxID=3880 RepID=A0A072V5W3_MEDTR|nr:hypothetical protein MTR_2g438620 [Medicago truncatula]
MASSSTHFPVNLSILKGLFASWVFGGGKTYGVVKPEFFQGFLARPEKARSLLGLARSGHGQPAKN